MIMYNMLIMIVCIFIFSSFLLMFFCKILFFLYIHYKKHCKFEKVHNKTR